MLGLGELCQHNFGHNMCMQHRSIFQHNTVHLASIIVQLAESTVYSLHWHLSDIQNDYSSKTDTYVECSGKVSNEALQLHVAIICHIQFTTGGLVLGHNI